jgi:hypothetical protein
VYQKTCFPDREKYFEHSYTPDDSRPPVFLEPEAWRNIIINPNTSHQEKNKLLAFLSKTDRHKWFRSMNSSQALAQSVLGNLATYNLLECLAKLNDDEGLPLLGNAVDPSNNFEMEPKVYYLGEPHPTSLDGYINGSYRIAIECKFTEKDIGTCSRPKLKISDTNFDRNCNGDYIRQRDREERCALTKIKILYWHYIPHFFKWSNDNDLTPCPLNKNYQLVRNILAVGVANKTLSVDDGHVLMIYDDRNPAFKKSGLIAYNETQAALREPKMLRKCSWQRIVQHIRQKELLPWLTEHLFLKYGL